jgi:hypothetical protein
MFDKVSQSAEWLATGVSRRGFLGWLGKGALAVAGVLGGGLAFSGRAQAGGGYVKCCGGHPKTACGNGGGLPACVWLCGGATIFTVCYNAKCAIPASGCVLMNGCYCPP